MGDATDKELEENIFEGKFDFNDREFDGVTETCKDLIVRMLVVEPPLRITVDDILKHPWITHESPTEPLITAPNKLRPMVEVRTHVRTRNKHHATNITRARTHATRNHHAPKKGTTNTLTALSISPCCSERVSALAVPNPIRTDGRACTRAAGPVVPDFVCLCVCACLLFVRSTDPPLLFRWVATTVRPPVRPSVRPPAKELWTTPQGTWHDHALDGAVAHRAPGPAPR